MGICFAIGAVFDFAYRQTRVNCKWAGPVLAGIFLALSFPGILNQLNHQYATNPKIAKSRAAESYWRDIQRLYPVLPPGANLYFVPYRKQADLEYYYDVTAGITLFQIIYPKVNTEFAEPEEVPVPVDSNTYVFGFDLNHIYEMTDEFRRRRTNEPSNL